MVVAPLVEAGYVLDQALVLLFPMRDKPPDGGLAGDFLPCKARLDGLVDGGDAKVGPFGQKALDEVLHMGWNG